MTDDVSTYRGTTSERLHAFEAWRTPKDSRTVKGWFSRMRRMERRFDGWRL